MLLIIGVDREQFILNVNESHSFTGIAIKQASYTTYVIGARIPRGSVTRALYWDTNDPYHYVRVVEGASSKDGDHYDVLMVGGEDDKSGQENDGDQRHSQLEAWARERFPMMESIELRWSGQVMEPVDGMAFIGRNPGDPRNVYMATGDSGMGMTHGTIAGILITVEYFNLVQPLQLTAPEKQDLAAFLKSL